MIAALFVATAGPYFGISEVDPWDEKRDARRYAGPWPVVAHPPCSRWCRLAGLVEARWPHHRRGEDGGCFASALASVRRWGGILEHPAYSRAWLAHGLNAPPRTGGWVNADFKGGWTCYVEQARYGHRARKGTWLYAVGCELPTLKWGQTPDQAAGLVSWCRNHSSDRRPRIHKREESRTPPEFRDLLLAIAASSSARPAAPDGRCIAAKRNSDRCTLRGKPWLCGIHRRVCSSYLPGTIRDCNGNPIVLAR